MKHAGRKIKKQKTKTNNIFTATVKYTFLIAVLCFLFINIILSQSISPTYFQMMNEDKNAVISYLATMRFSPLFPSELLKLKNIYGNGLENEVFGKEAAEKQVIQKYEQILQKNMYARDILYRLFSIFKEKGDTKLATDYFQRAKEIDPVLK